MARIVSTVVTQRINGLMTTNHTNGSFDVFDIKVGDIVEGLRWVEKETVKTISGKVQAVRYAASAKPTKNKVDNPKDYFADDVKITQIVIDASEHYKSNVVTINAREIVEFEGVTDVKSVFVTAHPVVDLDITYSDGTTDHQSLEVGDVLENVTIMTTPKNPDIVGNFKVAAFSYLVVGGKVNIDGLYLIPDEGSEYKKNVYAKFGNIISFVEVPSIEVTDTTSLVAITEALNEVDEVAVSLAVDVTIPLRDDGRITTTAIPAGKTLDLDLNGHTISCPAYAFYVTGGTLNISGEGKIEATLGPGLAYPAINVLSGGVCNMDGGLIDTTKAGDGDDNWLYGVVCSGDGVFNMNGGKILTQAASGISITNGTASGAGAQFIIGGDSVLEAVNCAAVYLADNKAVVIKDNAKVIGGIVARLGNISVLDNATVDSLPEGHETYPLGKLVCESGVDASEAAILALTGCYNSALGNDMNIAIAKTAKVNGHISNAIDIATIDTLYDQVVNVDIEDIKSITAANEAWNIYDHDELAAMATEQGKTLKPKAHDTDLTITVNGEVVYPVVDETDVDFNVDDADI